jgi:hypothetical protein
LRKESKHLYNFGDITAGERSFPPRVERNVSTIRRGDRPQAAGRPQKRKNSETASIKIRGGLWWFCGYGGRPMVARRNIAKIIEMLAFFAQCKNNIQRRRGGACSSRDIAQIIKTFFVIK